REFFMSKVSAILIARQGSSRLPGKSLKLIRGRPVVWHIINRLKYMDLFDRICLATTCSDIDKSLLELARQTEIDAFAGSEEDVLHRLYNAARLQESEIVVEIGGDCPFVDPHITRHALDV